MKTLRKILFSMLLLCVGLLTVNAAEAEPTNINLWKSIVTDLTPNIANPDMNCKYQGTGNDLIDLFVVGNECIATGIKTSEEEFSYGARGDSGSGDGVFNYGKVLASVNDTSNVDVLLSEIVELIYKDSSLTTKKLKSFAMSQTLAAGANSYILKAGSSDNALYVYGGYEGKTMSGIKLTFDNSSKKLTYSITYDESKSDEFYLATYFTRYLIDYIMEAAPNYDKAIEIVTNTEKLNLIKSDFVNRYGEVVNYVNPALKIEVGVFAKGDINDQIVSLYEAAVRAGTTNPGNGGNNGSQNEDEDDRNPNTGTFVNVFAIVALISVGTVLILGNKRKLFRI